MDQLPHTIAIVGAGFSGVMTAVNILRRAPQRATRVILIERGAELGRGAAYVRGDFPDLLNVPASRMSATMADPDEFLRFAQLHDPSVTGEDFLPRTLYGDYLNSLLDTAVAKARPGVRVEHVHGEVVDIEEQTPEELATLTLTDGTQLRAHCVVLALGTPVRQRYSVPRAAVPTVGPATGMPPGAAATNRPRSMLIIGTGLTMVDVVMQAVDRDPHVVIHALSRHGLLPQGQTAFEPDALLDDGGLLAMSSGSTARLMAAARRLAVKSERSGGDWREVVTLVRRQAPALWRSLPDAERARFLRHVRPFWDTHRHRMPPTHLSTIDALRSEGQLTIHAGRLLSVSRAEHGSRVTWMPRGATALRTVEVDQVIECTGPEYDIGRSTERLWQALIRRGLTRADRCQVGIRTGPYGALVGGDGATSRRLYYLGPLLRGDYWEATAVGELKMHSEHLARHLIERSAESASRRTPQPPEANGARLAVT